MTGPAAGEGPVDADWAAALAGPDGDRELVRRVVALAAAGGGSPQRQRRAALARLERCGSAEPRAVLGDLERVCRPSLWEASVDEAGLALARAGARVVVAGAPGYPERLAQLWPELGAPLWLFVRAAPDRWPPQGPAVAVVGTRHPSVDGVEMAEELGRLLASHGVLVVSGMARGIDEAAHEGALAAGGPTLAVLGTGFAVDYPRGRGALRERVAASAGLVSEVLADAGPRGFQFLDRNRIVSGLAEAVVVVEGRARSGALATARLAAEQGRDVWAVPGSPRQPTARAPLDLIRDGAQPLTRLDDVLEAVGVDAGRCWPAHPGGQAEPAWPGPDAPARTGGDGRRASTGSSGTSRPALPGGPAARDGSASAVAAALTAAPASAGALARATGLPLPAVLAALAALTAQGRARTTPRGWVSGGRG